MATLRIDETDYEIDELPQEVQAKVARMQEINAQIRSMNLQQQELQTVFQAYVNSIKQDLEPASELVE